ncbi:MAG: VWA domain-containing protein [Cyclobacteriaceae bacterium]|nr:VWA domain-containing protein [Cyclobacteriaceae bacterium]MCH8515372.1 VWA domain-containing protein [Cyclobacteriaceae bacterium]
MKDNWEWLSLRWFDPEVLRSFSWQEPWIIYLIYALPFMFFFRWLIWYRLSKKLDIALPEAYYKKDYTVWLRHIPTGFFMLFLVLLLVAAARPQLTNERVEQWTEGIDIILLIDISESMLYEDFKPNRLEVAKALSMDFVENRPNDRIGIVIFSGEAYSLAPLTGDKQLILNYLDELSTKMITVPGTAIGSGLAVAINRMRESKSNSKVVILLGDGDNNAGNVDPITAANLAKTFDIKVHSVAIGTDGQVPFGKDIFGRTRYLENTFDETTLREIAQITKGEFYQAANEAEFKDIFQKLDELEKTEVFENRYKDTKDYYRVYLYWALCFFGLWMLSKSSFMNNFMED